MFKYVGSLGHVLPPSFEEADAGQSASKGEILPISWQAMNHDEELSNPQLDPVIVIPTDALQLRTPGKLVDAIVKIKHISFIVTLDTRNRRRLCGSSWFGVDLFDTRSLQAESAGAVSHGMAENDSR